MVKRYQWRSVFLLSVVMIITQVLGFKGESLSMGGDQEPTAIVVDAETGDPIEGAVAIAIWRKKSVTKRAFWEGGTEIPVRIEEAVSDKEGKIYIDDFWDWHLFKGRYPHLTIYKPGYVCWDQEYIFTHPMWRRRNDFDKSNRVVRMEKWKKGYSYVDHHLFVGSRTRHEYHKASEKLFLNAFEKETPSRIYERRGKQRKEKDKGKKGD